jgi:hypothetical protein
MIAITRTQGRSPASAPTSKFCHDFYGVTILVFTDRKDWSCSAAGHGPYELRSYDAPEHKILLIMQWLHNRAASRQWVEQTAHVFCLRSRTGLKEAAKPRASLDELSAVLLITSGETAIRPFALQNAVH